MRSTARRWCDERGERRDFVTDRYRFDSVLAQRPSVRQESLGAANVGMNRLDTGVF
jgi:hypothetical protein